MTENDDETEGKEEEKTKRKRHGMQMMRRRQRLLSENRWRRVQSSRLRRAHPQQRSSRFGTSEGYDGDFSNCRQHNQQLIMVRLIKSQEIIQPRFEEAEKKLVALGSSFRLQAQIEQVNLQHRQYLEMIEQMSALQFTKEGCLALQELINTRQHDLKVQIASLLKNPHG